MKAVDEKEKAPKMNNHKLQTIIVVGLVLLVLGISGSAFLESRKIAPIYPGPGVTSMAKLSDYLPNLKGTAGDSDIYVLDSGVPGGTALIMGGTHSDEPSGYITGVLLVENAMPSTGRLIVIPQVNRSGFTHNTPLEGFPSRFTIETSGGERWFNFGGRLANAIDQWPDPDVYLHYPSGQKLSGEETRNLNRSYPGRPDGVFIERVAYAITTLVQEEKVDVTIDLHEAPLEYFFIDAIAAHSKGIEVAVMTSLDLSFEDIDLGLESAPTNLHGFSHNEIGTYTNSMTFLMESANPTMGRLRGRTDANLVVEGKDLPQMLASKLRRTFVKYDEEGKPLSLRVARHLTASNEIFKVFSEMNPEKSIELSNIPSYTEVIEKGLGEYLNPPSEEQ